MEVKRPPKARSTKRSIAPMSPKATRVDTHNFYSFKVHAEGGKVSGFTPDEIPIRTRNLWYELGSASMSGSWDHLEDDLVELPHVAFADPHPSHHFLALRPTVERGSLAIPEAAIRKAFEAALSGKPRHEPLSHKVQGKTDNVLVVVIKSAAELAREESLLSQQTPDFGTALVARVMELVGPAELVAARVLAEPQARIDQLLLAAARALGQESPASASASVTALSEDDPLRAARERGRQFALDEWAKPENLPLREAAAYASRSDRAINEARLKGRLYALVPPGKQRGLRYPQWQFDAEPDRLAEVLAPFVQNHASCWVVHNFMQRPLEAIGDSRPMDWILDGSKPIALLVAAAGNRFAGDQGAA